MVKGFVSKHGVKRTKNNAKQHACVTHLSRVTQM